MMDRFFIHLSVTESQNRHDRSSIGTLNPFCVFLQKYAANFDGYTIVSAFS